MRGGRLGSNEDRLLLLLQMNALLLGDTTSLGRWEQNGMEGLWHLILQRWSESDRFAINTTTYRQLLSSLPRCKPGDRAIPSGADHASFVEALVVFWLACMKQGLALDSATLEAVGGIHGAVLYTLTSGSTGAPKRIAIDAAVFTPCVEHWSECILERDDRVLLVVLVSLFAVLHSFSHFRGEQASSHV
jgi:hypothetical protein